MSGERMSGERMRGERMRGERGAGSGERIVFRFPFSLCQAVKVFVWHAEDAESAEFYFGFVLNAGAGGAQTSLRQECAEAERGEGSG